MTVQDPALSRPGLFLLNTPEASAVAPFYAALFGWELAAGDVFTVEGEPVAAVAPGDGGWLPFFTVSDVEAALILVKDAGGTQVSAISADAHGRRVVAKDPTDTPFGLWEVGSGPGSSRQSQLNSVIWLEQKTRRQDAAADFLSSVFGYTPVGPQGPGKVRALIGAGQPLFGGVMQFDDRWSADHPAHWLLYVEVDDVEAAIQRALGSGGSPWFPLTQTPLGPLAYVRDPAGNAIALVCVSEGGRKMINS